MTSPGEWCFSHSSSDANCAGDGLHSQGSHNEQWDRNVAYGDTKASDIEVIQIFFFYRQGLYLENKIKVSLVDKVFALPSNRLLANETLSSSGRDEHS